MAPAGRGILLGVIFVGILAAGVWIYLWGKFGGNDTSSLNKLIRSKKHKSDFRQKHASAKSDVSEVANTYQPSEKVVSGRKPQTPVQAFSSL